MEVIRINKVNYRVDEQALQGRPAHCHRAAPIRGRVFTLCKTAPIIIHLWARTNKLPIILRRSVFTEDAILRYLRK